MCSDGCFISHSQKSRKNVAWIHTQRQQVQSEKCLALCCFFTVYLEFDSLHYLKTVLVLDAYLNILKLEERGGRTWGQVFVI